MEIKMVIIAGNFREYVVYITENDLDRAKCPYVYHGDMLKAYSPETPILLVGSYIKNPASQWQELFERFKEVRTVNEYESTTD